MSWAAELKRVRRLVRDPDGNIWSNAFLRHLYNDVQQDLQHKTGVLEDVVAERVPQLYHYAHSFDWEYRYVPGKWSQIYQCLTQHGQYVISARWESQAIARIDSGVADYGVHFTQPWEAFMGQTPGEEVKMRFPQNFNSVKFIAYDEEPILPTNKKAVQSSDPSHLTRIGEPFAYYPYDETDNSYVLYPIPSASFQNDLSGEGLAFYESGDSENDTTGVIVARDDDTPSSSYGGPTDIVDVANNVFLVYDVSPSDMVASDDEPDFPPFIRKYIRFGVASRAFDSNTDGKIPSLAAYWGRRYTLGVDFVKQFVRNRRTDRNYRLTTKGLEPRRNRRLPRLPDGYPAVNP